jgi:hypothetical protein
MQVIGRLLAATCACAALIAAGSAGAAAVYNDVTDFGNTNPGGVWTYGTGTTGSSIIPDTVYTNNCLQNGWACWQSASTTSNVPIVLKNNNGSTQSLSTLILPTDVLLVHPGPVSDSIVEFTAPKAGTYDLSGFFELLDTNPSGVNVIYGTSGDLTSQTLSGPGATQNPDSPGEKVSFAQVLHLTAGENYYFGVNNDGSFNNDSTGLAATFTAVPEPASWGLMLLGFAAAGGAMRTARRRNATALAVAPRRASH